MLNLDSFPQRRLVPNTDITSVRHQLRAESLNDAASTRELDPLLRTVNTSQNHNNRLLILETSWIYKNIINSSCRLRLLRIMDTII